MKVKKIDIYNEFSFLNKIGEAREQYILFGNGKWKDTGM